MLMLRFTVSFADKAFLQADKCLFRNAPLDIWGGGGGLEFLLLANFFFTSARKRSFFWRSTSDNFFFMFRRRNEISFFCHILSLLYTLTFDGFSGQHIFHKSRQQTFFLPIFLTIFLSDFCGNKLFISIFSYPPPPQISKGASLIIHSSI